MYIFKFLVLFLFLNSCGGTTEQTSQPEISSNPQPKSFPKLNIIILLDLSDRILVPDQIDRDIAILDNLYAIFLKRIQEQLYFKSKDKFRVVLSFQNNVFSNNRIFTIENDLYTDMESIHVTKKVEIKNSFTDYNNKIRELYSLAKFSTNPNDYTGADIQGYLKNRLQDDLVSDTAINKLIILTDGYQYVQNISKGLEVWPPSTDLSNVEVYVVEMTPYANKPNEKQLMQKDWTDWLNSMNAKKQDLIFQDAINQVNQRLSEGILGKAMIQNMPIKSAPNSSNSASEGIDGTYIGIVNKVGRSIQIIKISENQSTINLVCNYIPMGHQYQNLKGSFNKVNNLLTIDVLGTFSLDSKDGKYSLISNSLNAVFVK